MKALITAFDQSLYARTYTSARCFAVTTFKLLLHNYKHASQKPISYHNAEKQGAAMVRPCMTFFSLLTISWSVTYSVRRVFHTTNFVTSSIQHLSTVSRPSRHPFPELETVSPSHSVGAAVRDHINYINLDLPSDQSIQTRQNLKVELFDALSGLR